MLPIDGNKKTFDRVIEDTYYYVDKTPLVKDLLDEYGVPLEND